MQAGDETGMDEQSGLHFKQRALCADGMGRSFCLCARQRTNFGVQISGT
jgi:hypothetical protein